MPRELNIPAQQIYEGIQSLQEFPNSSLINVVVGVTDAQGVFVTPQQYKTYRILDEMYTELNGPPTSWAPDKPDGTFRNDDLWHFIDILRNTNAE